MTHPGGSYTGLFTDDHPDDTDLYLTTDTNGKQGTAHQLPIPPDSDKSTASTAGTKATVDYTSYATTPEPGTPNNGSSNGLAQNLPGLYTTGFYETKKNRAQAQSAIDRLQTPASTQSQNRVTTKTATDAPPRPIILPKWSQYKQSLLTANINVLMNNATTAQERQNADAYLATQGDLRILAQTANTQQGVKRQRDPVADGQTAAGQQPLKRLRRNSKAVLTQSPANVFTLPRPIRIQYHPLPLKDRDDQWYAALFRRLFTDVVKFVDDYFILHDLVQGDSYQPWALKWNPEFIFWADQVAEDDPQVGNWDELLRDSSERKWFLVAVIVRIIKVKIFDADLWGANQQQKDLLLAIERSMFQRDGMLRALQAI
jgi:hypothetical protein